MGIAPRDHTDDSDAESVSEPDAFPKSVTRAKKSVPPHVVPKVLSSAASPPGVVSYIFPPVIVSTTGPF